MNKPSFYIGVGIENCWMAEHNELNRSPKRLLDVFLQMQHYTRWDEDLELAVDLGINAIRYSVPWYKSNPKPGVYDWSWVSGPIQKLVRKGICPVIDLIHYGTPLWMENGVLNHAFPERIADYSAAFSHEFAGLVNHFTPHNEPQLSAWFGGNIAYWPPYLTGLDGWVKVGLNVARGMVLSSQALRSACSDAVLISADTLVSAMVEAAWSSLGISIAANEQASFDYLVKTFPACLAYGKVDENSLFARFLQEFGVRPEQIEWFRLNAQPPDIVGHNYYPMFLEEQDGPIEQCIYGGIDVLKRRLRKTAAFYQRPVYLTETSAGTTTAEKVQWLEHLFQVITDLRREGVPVVGLNWWPLYETIQWEYRDNSKTVAECIYGGGWNNGLYRIEERQEGALERIPTGAERGYQQLVRRLKAVNYAEAPVQE